MKILTVENEAYELDTVPEEIDDLRYCVLDATSKEDVDFFKKHDIMVSIEDFKLENVFIGHSFPTSAIIKAYFHKNDRNSEMTEVI